MEYIKTILLALSLVADPRHDGLHDPNPDTLLIEPYHDPAGYPTIGYGTKLSNHRWDLLSNYKAIPIDVAVQYLYRDLNSTLAYVMSVTRTDLTSCQYAALVDLVYNIGRGNYRKSRLLKAINKGDYEEAKRQYMRWVYTGKKKLPGLVKRRESGLAMWSRPGCD